MTTPYYLTTTASDLDRRTADNFSNTLDETAPGTTTLVVTLANGDGTAAIDETDTGYTLSGVPGASGSTGNWTASVEVNTGDTNVELDLEIARVNSSGTLQSGPTASNEGLTACGAGSLSFTWTSLNLGTFAAGDRIEVSFLWNNTSTHGGDESVTLDIGSAGTVVTAPWSSPISRSATALNAGATLGTHALSFGATALAATNYGSHNVGTTYWLTKVTSDLDPLPADNFNYEMSTVAPADDTISITVPAGDGTAADEETDTVFTPPVQPGADGQTCDYQLTMVISSGTPLNLRSEPNIGRADGTTGAYQAGGSDPAEGQQILATGTVTWTWANKSFGTWAAGDRMRITWGWNNINTGGPESITFDVGETKTRFFAGWLSKLTYPTGLNAGATLGTHALSFGATALDSTPTKGTHAAQLATSATALDASPTYGTHTEQVAGGSINKDATPGLNAAPTYGTHEVSLATSATALTGTTYGTHGAGVSLTATALDASPTYGTHATQLASSATALTGTTYGTHAAQLATSATVLDNTPTKGTHDAGVSVTATALTGTTYGTHATQLATSATALTGTTLGTHSAGVSVNATALDASPTLGTHASSLATSATALTGTTYGTHAVSLETSATGLDASPTLGTHSAALATSATGLDTSPTYGAHAAQFATSATGLDASPTYGTHSYGIVGGGLTKSPTALDASPGYGTALLAIPVSVSAAGSVGTAPAKTGSVTPLVFVGEVETYSFTGELE